jgi:class 3 adenylate cyclase
MLRRTLRASAEEHGVRVTKWLGDGAMLSGTDARHVVACAVDVRDTIAQRSPLPVRGGLATGGVIMFEGDDYIGAAVNTAARLADVADPNELLITGALTRALRGVTRGRAATSDRGARPAGLPRRPCAPSRGVERGRRACRDGTGPASRGRLTPSF